MSIVDNIISINKRLAEINITNLEAIHMLKHPKVAHYLHTVTDCYEKHHDNDNKYFTCVVSDACSLETKAFKDCVSKNSDTSLCVGELYNLDKCVKNSINSTLVLLQKAKNY